MQVKRVSVDLGSLGNIRNGYLVKFALLQQFKEGVPNGALGLHIPQIGLFHCLYPPSLMIV